MIFKSHPSKQNEDLCKKKKKKSYVLCSSQLSSKGVTKYFNGRELLLVFVHIVIQQQQLSPVAQQI